MLSNPFLSPDPQRPNSISVRVLVMAKDPLSEAGLHFDELNKLRILEPDVAQKTTELKEECKEFVDSKYGVILTVI